MSLNSQHLKETLIKFGLCRDETLGPFYPRVRDREDIAVLRDSHSGVILLSSTNHIDTEHYEEMREGEYWQSYSRSEGALKYNKDDVRRAKQFEADIKQKDFVDIGCGTGGVIEYFRSLTQSVTGVELQKSVRESLRDKGVCMFRTSSELPTNCYDVATLFHVLEHLTNPVEELIEVHRALRKGGKVIVEVPHARDALLDLDAFKSFSLWSEHLMLHTRESLAIFLEKAGFSNIKVQGFQRYPLANHVGWLVYRKPGAPNVPVAFDDVKLLEEYTRLLEEADKTDTLIAIAEA